MILACPLTSGNHGGCRKALEASSDSVVLLDNQGVIIWVNSAFTVMTGYSFEEAAINNPWIIKSEKNKPLWDTITSGNIWRGEADNQRKDGRSYCEEMTITPIRDCAGEIVNYLAAKKDVTDQRFLEKLLIESEKRFRSVFDNVHTGMVVVQSPNDKITEVNQAFCHLTGYSRSELLRKALIDLIHEDDQAETFKLFSDFCDDKFKPRSLKKRFIRKDGAVIWTEATVAVVDRDINGNLRVVEQIVDIDIQQRSEAELQRYIRKTFGIEPKPGKSSK